jgi:hypothetical protein
VVEEVEEVEAKGVLVERESILRLLEVFRLVYEEGLKEPP